MIIEDITAEYLNVKTEYIWCLLHTIVEYLGIDSECLFFSMLFAFLEVIWVAFVFYRFI